MDCMEVKETEVLGGSLVDRTTIVSSASTTPRRHRTKRIMKAVLEQVEFYFSDANLKRDHRLRNILTSSEDGYVSVETVASFSRMTALTTDMKVIRTALRKSAFLEVSSDGNLLRRKDRSLPRMVFDDRCILYTENLPHNADITWIKTVFSTCGHVTYISLPRYKHTGAIKGFAFVEYATSEEARTGWQVLNTSSRYSPTKWKSWVQHHIPKDTRAGSVEAPAPVPSRSEFSPPAKRRRWRSESNTGDDVAGHNSSATASLSITSGMEGPIGGIPVVRTTDLSMQQFGIKGLAQPGGHDRSWTGTRGRRRSNSSSVIHNENDRLVLTHPELVTAVTMLPCTSTQPTPHKDGVGQAHSNQSAPFDLGSPSSPPCTMAATSADIISGGFSVSNTPVPRCKRRASDSWARPDPTPTQDDMTESQRPVGVAPLLYHRLRSQWRKLVEDPLIESIDVPKGQTRLARKKLIHLLKQHRKMRGPISSLVVVPKEIWTKTKVIYRLVQRAECGSTKRFLRNLPAEASCSKSGKDSRSNTIEFEELAARQPGGRRKNRRGRSRLTARWNRYLDQQADLSARLAERRESASASPSLPPVLIPNRGVSPPHLPMGPISDPGDTFSDAE